MTLHIAFLPDCDIFRGHFPGRPVCPGACNIQLIKELAMRLTGHKLCASIIKQCRFTALITPDTCPEADVQINISRHDEYSYTVTARIYNEGQTYVEFKGDMTIV